MAVGKRLPQNPSSGRFLRRLDADAGFLHGWTAAKHNLYNLGFGDMSLTVLGLQWLNPIRFGRSLTFRFKDEDWPVDFNTSRFLMLNAGDPAVSGSRV